LPEEWPAPAPLEGVKSRKRAIFEVRPGAEVPIGDGILLVAGTIALTLESRVAATSEAGAALVALLLGNGELTAGSVWRHEGIVVSRIGPDLAAATGGTAGAALSAALERRPQVVILEEAHREGDWVRTFHDILGSDALRTFRGAVVVWAAEETRAVRRACSERWAVVGEQLWQLEVELLGADVLVDPEETAETGADAREVGTGAGATVLAASESSDAAMAEVIMGDFLVLEDALNGAAACGSGTLAELLEEVRILSDSCFKEEDSAKLAIEKGWSLALLASRCPDNMGKRLRGFLCHQVLPPPRAEFCIKRIAVPEEHRGLGLGKALVRWAIGKAAQMPQSECKWISVSALNEAASFYEALGFTDMTCGEIDTEDGAQTWMEMKNVSLVPEVA